jgi:3'-5' exonuclease
VNHLGRRTLTIDIETLPSLAPVDDGRKARDGAKIVDEHSRTALSGDFGRILCVGFADDDGRGGVSYGCLGWNDSRQQLMYDERQLLTDFWELMRGFRTSVDRLVGHNLFDFDLKFIYKRSVVHGVKPSVELSFARYRNQPLYDTMCEWERWGYGSKISLDRLARILSLQSSKTDAVDGSRVGELFAAGEHKVIRDYCLRDVELTRSIYRRLTFAEDVACAGTPGGDVIREADEFASREAAAAIF